MPKNTANSSKDKETVFDKLPKDTKTKEVKAPEQVKKPAAKMQEQPKKVAAKVTVEDVNSDDDDEEEDESEDESEDEQTKTEQKLAEKKAAKEKVKKLTFEECFKEIDTLANEDNTLDSEIVECNKKLQALEKRKNVIKKSMHKLYGQLSKSHTDDVNKARKEKSKRKNNSNSGILKEQPIPIVLTKFLGIPEDTIMMRPKVMSMLNNKFKELGLKDGQSTTLDKKTAKVFGLEAGHVIEFKQFQTFLKTIYDSSGIKNTEVSL